MKPLLYLPLWLLITGATTPQPAPRPATGNRPPAPPPIKPGERQIVPQLPVTNPNALPGRTPPGAAPPSVPDGTTPPPDGMNPPSGDGPPGTTNPPGTTDPPGTTNPPGPSNPPRGGPRPP